MKQMAAELEMYHNQVRPAKHGNRVGLMAIVTWCAVRQVQDLKEEIDRHNKASNPRQSMKMMYLCNYILKKHQGVGA